MLYQNLTQKQQLKIHPQQLQMLHLFHLNTMELEQRIVQEIEENPMIEEKNDQESASEVSDETQAQEYQDWDEYGYDDTPDYKLENSQFYQQTDLPNKPLVEIADFRSELLNQYSLLNVQEQDRVLGAFIINNLTDEGFLEMSAETLAEDFSLKNSKWFDPSVIETQIRIIQQLDPVGVGARSIQECLLIQLKRMNTRQPDVKLAIKLLEDHYDDLKQRNFEKLYDALDIDDEDLRITLEMIGTLKMKPMAGCETSSNQQETVMPDFILREENDRLEVSLVRERSSHLHISNSWKSMVNAVEKGKNKGEAQYLKNKLNAAEWFVSAIKQRESTMLGVMKTILKLQYDYFATGDESLIKPMILKNVAERVGVDISTVSRITCNKYVQTPFGNILLKNLFNEGLENAAGELVSVRKIQETLEEVIQQEDKRSPYSDQQLVLVLARKGLKIARRTVAKYREELKIPTAQLRSLWTQQRTTVLG
jgi:RNA polymerase sigma-54 factor